MITYRGGEKSVKVIYSGQAEVCEFQRPVPGEENVLWLDVPVHDAVAVQEVHPAQQLPHQVLDLVLGEAGRRALGQVGVEVLVHVLEHEVEDHLAVVARAVADVLQLDDVGVVVLAEVAQQRDLPQDGHGHPVLGQGDAHFLHGDYLIVLQIFGFVNCAISSWKLKYITALFKQMSQWIAVELKQFGVFGFV